MLWLGLLELDSAMQRLNITGECIENQVAFLQSLLLNPVYGESNVRAQVTSV